MKKNDKVIRVSNTGEIRFSSEPVRLEKHNEMQADDTCGCGHTHAKNQVLVGEMDGHTLGTISCYTAAILPVAEMNTKYCMMDISLGIKELGGMPMQVKASLKDPAETVILNMLGSDIFRSGSKESTETDETAVKVNIMTICDGLSQAALREKLEEIMGYLVDNAF